MTFEEFIVEFGKYKSLCEEANIIREFWDDYGAVPGCDCGCGGDTFDWDGQDRAFKEADELDKQANKILEKLRKAWEER